MRRNSFPSPSRSVLVNEEDNPAALLRFTPPTPSQDQTEAQTEVQSSLQQASASLEAAYRRIRHIRRNLLEVTENMSTTVQALGRPSASESSDSILDQPTGRATDPAPRDLSFPDDEFYVISDHDRSVSTRPSSNRRPELPPLSTSGTVHSTPENLDSPHFSQRSYPFLRLPQLESRSYRRPEPHSDDPSTSLGRRVAAREAAGLPNSAAIHTTTALNSLSRFDANSAQLLASIERDIEHFRSVARQRRSEPSLISSPASQDNATSFASTTLTNRTLDTNVSRRHPQVNTTASSSPVGLHPDSRRHQFDGSVYSSRPSLSAQSERLSLLSNFSLQNLPTPVSAGAPRSLIFDEPSSYIRSSDFLTRFIRSDRMEDSDARNYVVRRRYNIDGEEHVHPINLEWMDEPLPWIGPTVTREHERRVGSTTQSSSSTSASSGPSRRRGWARLDQDGNEIPSDEEEELERIRAEYRIQSQARSRGAAESAEGVHSLQATTTSAPSHAPDEDAGIRVRLNAQDTFSLHGGIDNVDGFLCKGQGFLPSFRPNPLPMPIEDMVRVPAKHKLPSTVVVPRRVTFAGR